MILCIQDPLFMKVDGKQLFLRTVNLSYFLIMGVREGKFIAYFLQVKRFIN